MTGADADGARSDAPEHLIVGHITRPHGIKGEVMVSVLTDGPETVYAPGRTVQLGDEQGELPPGAPALTVEKARVYKRGLLVKFEEIPDRTAAESYAGRYLLAPLESLEPLREGELFYHQLLGLEVVTREGERVGRVREIYETAPSHLLEVEGDGKEHLIPFTEQVVEEVDLEAGRLVIAPPPGLLEL